MALPFSNGKQRMLAFPFVRGLRLGTGIVAASLAMSLAAVADPLAPTPAEIIEALKPRPMRGLSVKPSQAEMERVKSIEELSRQARTRGLSVPERTELAEATKNNPSYNLVIYFEFNSATVMPQSRKSLDSLGTALKDQSLQTASLLIAGHTDAKGRAEYNQNLSERRAEAVRGYLVDKFNLSSDRLTVVGYGAERLKLPYDPYAKENRRVQVINLTDRTTENKGK